MEVAVAQIIAELDGLLQPQRFKDHGPNGLQVPGRPQVSRIATGVSANLELFERARDQGVELLIVHHGLFWGSGFGLIDLALKRRLQILFDTDMGLAAYHLPLDAHPVLGNNALLARALGADELEPIAMHHGTPIGFLASFAKEIPTGELVARVSTITDREPLLFEYGPPEIKRLAIVSGGGTDFLSDAIAVGADAFLTGEPTERAMAQAREGKIHYIAAGHYATEVFGVKRLGEHLAQRFDLQQTFLDVPNPV